MLAAILVKQRVFTRCYVWCLNIRYPMYLLEFKNMCMQDCFRMPHTMTRLLIWLYLLELKWKTCSCRIVSDDIHKVMASDMVVPAGSYKRNYWIMQDFSRMSDPMSWHPVHRTFSMNVWCFVIAQLMAIFGWLKIWLAGAFNHGLQPDLLIFQGDLTSYYKKIWLENRFRVFKMSKPSWKLL